MAVSAAGMRAATSAWVQKEGDSMFGLMTLIYCALTKAAAPVPVRVEARAPWTKGR